ncbi:hypothetical protein [Clostridium algidicarnis]|uniref:hypothetical protein n=1 Tax=Clostridium algidicarnis TaxID=37659 RepID=UPI001C0B3519|nr:hypothetical protein [Clostridium algidicarnis]MBU3194869.1 hypothetical protein [Clostridium algidicarnis]
MGSSVMTASYCKAAQDNKVSFVFLCPGQIEEMLSKPICGATGADLECLISELQADINLANYFKYNCRYKYRIINLSETVYYKGSKNGNKPNKLQIESKEKVKRLQESIKDMELILVFNLEYKGVFQKRVLLEDKVVKNIIYSRHLSSQAINQMDKDGDNVKIGSNSEGNLKRRIKVISKESIKQFKIGEV